MRSKVALRHPDSEDLAFLYGTIVTDGKDVFSDEPTVNLTVFADREVSNDLVPSLSSALPIPLCFRQVAPFPNQSASKATAVENRGQISEFLPPPRKN